MVCTTTTRDEFEKKDTPKNASCKPERKKSEEKPILLSTTNRQSFPGWEVAKKVNHEKSPQYPVY